MKREISIVLRKMFPRLPSPLGNEAWDFNCPEGIIPAFLLFGSMKRGRSTVRRESSPAFMFLGE
jgi:hypothetical protein